MKKIIHGIFAVLTFIVFELSFALNEAFIINALYNSTIKVSPLLYLYTLALTLGVMFLCGLSFGGYWNRHFVSKEVNKKKGV